VISRNDEQPRPAPDSGVEQAPLHQANQEVLAGFAARISISPRKNAAAGLINLVEKPWRPHGKYGLPSANRRRAPPCLHLARDRSRKVSPRRAPGGAVQHKPGRHDQQRMAGGRGGKNRIEVSAARCPCAGRGRARRPALEFAARRSRRRANLGVATPRLGFLFPSTYRVRSLLRGR